MNSPFDHSSQPSRLSIHSEECSSVLASVLPTNPMRTLQMGRQGLQQEPLGL